MPSRSEIQAFLASIGHEAAANDQSSLCLTEAIVEALMEPTKAMLDAGIDAIEDATDWTRDSNESYIVTESSDYALPCWRAMWAARFRDGG